MQISAALVKELRERTGAGMMECKRALVDAEGSIDAAVEAMRKSGQAKADKKAGRVAAEGLIGTAVAADGGAAAMVEVNCETDFVAKEGEFRDFVSAVAASVLSDRPADVEALGALPFGDTSQSIEERRRDLIAKIGENMAIRRFELVEAIGGVVGNYVHGGRIGVLVALQSGPIDVAKDVAMHVAASRPLCLDESQIPAEELERERSIFAAQAAESGKPIEIIEKMVTGRIRKFVNEVTLLGQPFVKDQDQTVQQYLKKAGASVVSFQRLEVGEGIEKKSENFADEVRSQIERAGGDAD
ncbi:MAG: elongation factor Ts [Chromatiales bacterium]|jgi:elongation factor Ts|nr:elongation factor Ts [Chromatiales bacterium]